MFQQHIPVGPAASAPTSKIDRTRILDPNDYWRDPMACPDWPCLGPNQGFDGRRGKEGAEERLEAIGLYLNRGPGQLRVPTAAEREQEFAKTFRRHGSNWYSLGIHNLAPLGRMVEGEADLMAEACHLRGYLRKLEATAARDAEAKKRREESEARRTLEEYRAKAPDHIEQIRVLAPAVARHLQRLEDEKAVSLTRMHRDQVETLHSAAVRAAHTLGLGVPDAPEV